MPRNSLLNQMSICCRIDSDLTCPMDVYQFPFDEHKCTITVTSCKDTRCERQLEETSCRCNGGNGLQLHMEERA